MRLTVCAPIYIVAFATALKGGASSGRLKSIFERSSADLAGGSERQPLQVRNRFWLIASGKRFEGLAVVER